MFTSWLRKQLKSAQSGTNSSRRIRRSGPAARRRFRPIVEQFEDRLVPAGNLVVTSFTPTPSGFVATFNEPFNPSVINIYDTYGNLGPADVTLTGALSPVTSYHGSLIIDPTDTTITFVKTSTFTNSVNVFDPSSGVLAAGSYVATFRSAANGFKDFAGNLLAGNGIPGDNFVSTFVVGPSPVAVGIPSFARGPDSAQVINLPNNLGFGIPISLSNGAGVTSGTFTLQYNPSYLNISGATVSSVLPGATLAVSTSATANPDVADASITFTSPTSLPAGMVRLGGLVATVPNSALSSYTSTALLHFAGEQLNSGAIPATGSDAVQLVAYFGDVNADLAFSGGDSALLSRVAVGIDNVPTAGVIGGFSAYPLISPTVVGDLTSSGSVGAGAVTLMNSFLSGVSRQQFPPIPQHLTASPPGPNLPAAVNDVFGIGAGATLSVASLGILSNDNDLAGNPLTVASVDGHAANVGVTITLASGATLLVNANGSFVYTPPANFVGPDSFTYQALDSVRSLVSNTATVNLVAGARLSMPTNLNASPGGTVVVPVNIDNADPTGTGGLDGIVLAINYDPAVFTVNTSDINWGTVTDTNNNSVSPNPAWAISSNITAATGQIAIAVSTPLPSIATAGGSLVLITFHVNPGAILGPSAISIVPSNNPGAGSNNPSGPTITTRLDGANCQIPIEVPPASTASSPLAVSDVTIAPPALIVSSFTPTATGFVVTFNKTIDPSTISLYDTAGNAGPSDVTLTGPGAPQTSFRGSLVIDPTSTTITFLTTGTGPAGVLAAGTYTATFRSAVNAFKDMQGGLLAGSNGVPGGNFTATFTVAAAPTTILSIPDFARGPAAATLNPIYNIKVPNNTGTGIPITLNGAAGVNNVTFNLSYNPALLNITGTLNGPAGSSFALVSNSGGVASFQFNLGTAAALGGTATLGQIVAQVPASAAADYRDLELLHLSSIVVNGGAITATGNDGVHANVYLGDTNGDGVLTPGDAALISRAATSLDSNPADGIMGGFCALSNLDPAIVGDLTGSGSVTSTSVTLLDSYLAGTPHSQIPPIPTGLTIPPVGPDPTLSLGAAEQSAPGTFVIPINIDTARPGDSTGMTEAVLALQFDPKVITVSAGDVQLGNLPASSYGWQLRTAINSQTGEVGIDLFGSTPVQTTSAGTLVTITLHVQSPPQAGTPELYLVSNVQPSASQAFRTEASDVQGAFVLHSVNAAAVLTPSDTAASVAVAPSGVSPISASNLSTSTQGQFRTDGAASAKESLPIAILDETFANLTLLGVEQMAFAAPAAILPFDPNGQQTATADDKMVLGTPLALSSWMLTPNGGLVHSLQPASVTSPDADGEELDGSALELTALGRGVVFGAPFND